MGSLTFDGRRKSIGLITRGSGIAVVDHPGRAETLVPRMALS